MIIRPETTSDIAAITQITEEAFRGQAYSQQTEHRIVLALRDSGALFISVVAEVDDQVGGHAAFSLVTIDKKECGWYGLGPLSVKPEYQRQGIGSALVRNGLHDLKASGAEGCVLVGDPAYYSRLGFTNDTKLSMQDIPQENILAFSFGKPIPEGVLDFDPSFWV
jgi:putative acetyltransferase